MHRLALRFDREQCSHKTKEIDKMLKETAGYLICVTLKDLYVLLPRNLWRQITSFTVDERRNSSSSSSRRSRSCSLFTT